MTITLHWWMLMLLPVVIVVAGFIRASISDRSDSGLSSGMEGALIRLGSLALAGALATGLLIGHFA